MNRYRFRKITRNPTYRVMAGYLFVVLAVFVVMWQANSATTQRLERQADEVERTAEALEKQVEARCDITNNGRIEGNKRGRVIREFLLTAAETRQAAALASKEPWERLGNAKAAKRYRQLATQIDDYPYLDCDDDGKPDGP